MPLDSASNYPAGLDLLYSSIREAVYENSRPPPKLTLSQWAAEYAMLSKETSAQTGRFRAYGYQPGIMDAVTDPTIEQVTLMKGARIGYTKILDHVVGFFIHQDPSPILVVQPREDDADDYSRTEIEPMLRDTPVLAEIMGNPASKGSGQTVSKRIFRNGASVTFVGANSPGGFRRITCKVILLDEVDGYPIAGAGQEGDQIKLAIKRSETFWNRKIVIGSTPTIKGQSRIEASYLEGDQRKYMVECPHCATRQELVWGGKTTPHGIKWPKDEHGHHQPEKAFYVCEANGCIIEEVDKPQMIAGGQWVASKPFRGHASFHISALYSLHVNASWAKLAAEWLEVKANPLLRQTFINLVLGLPYEDRGNNALSEHSLAAQTEVWAAEVPDGVAVVTCGVDTQDYRVELEFVGWGRNEESWSIFHEVIEGDLDTVEFWDQVDHLLKRRWRRADGREFPTMAACVDSGGHHTQRVYDFAKARLGRKIWAIKGESARNGERNPVWPVKRPSSRTKATFRPVIIGVNAAKDVVRTRLALDPPSGGEPTPGYMHFPSDRDVNYFAQLLSERSITKIVGAKKVRIWDLMSGRANEALDCRVYAYAALCGLQHFGLKLNRWADAVETHDAEMLQEHAPADEKMLAHNRPAIAKSENGKPIPEFIPVKSNVTKRKWKLSGRIAGA